MLSEPVNSEKSDPPYCTVCSVPDIPFMFYISSFLFLVLKYHSMNIIM